MQSLEVDMQTKSLYFSECGVLLVSVGQLCNPLVHPGQNKDVQKIIKKFFVKKKVDEPTELVTVHKEHEEIKEDNNEKLNEVENEWLIVIKLQVFGVKFYMSMSIVDGITFTGIWHHHQLSFIF